MIAIAENAQNVLVYANQILISPQKEIVVKSLLQESPIKAHMNLEYDFGYAVILQIWVHKFDQKVSSPFGAFAKMLTRDQKGSWSSGRRRPHSARGIIHKLPNR